MVDRLHCLLSRSSFRDFSKNKMVDSPRKLLSTFSFCEKSPRRSGLVLRVRIIVRVYINYFFEADPLTSVVNREWKWPRSVFGFSPKNSVGFGSRIREQTEAGTERFFGEKKTNTSVGFGRVFLPRNREVRKVGSDLKNRQKNEVWFSVHNTASNMSRLCR